MDTADWEDGGWEDGGWEDNGRLGLKKTVKRKR